MPDEPASEPVKKPRKRTLKPPVDTAVPPPSEKPARKPRTRTVKAQPEAAVTPPPITGPVILPSRRMRFDWRHSYIVLSVIVPLLSGLAPEAVLFCLDREQRHELIEWNTKLADALQRLDPASISKGFTQRMGDEYGTKFYTWRAPFDISYQRRLIDKEYQANYIAAIAPAARVLATSTDVRGAERQVLQEWVDDEQRWLNSIPASPPAQIGNSAIAGQLGNPQSLKDEQNSDLRYQLPIAIKADCTEPQAHANVAELRSIALDVVEGVMPPASDQSSTLTLEMADESSIRAARSQFYATVIAKQPAIIAVASPTQSAIAIAAAKRDGQLNSLARHELPPRYRGVLTYVVIPGLISGYAFILTALFAGSWLQRGLGIFVMVMGALAVFPLGKDRKPLFPLLAIPLPGGNYLPIGNQSREGCLPLRLVTVPVVGTFAAWILWAVGMLATSFFTMLLAPKIDVAAAMLSTPVTRFIFSTLTEHNLTERARGLIEGEVEHVLRPK